MLSETRRQRQPERYQRKAEKWLCSCIANICTFCSRPQQNNNVKRISSAYFATLNFRSLIWNSTPALHI